MEPSFQELPADQRVRDLLYDVLYGDFGVARDAEWLHAEDGGVFALATAPDASLLGVIRLMPATGEASRQLRQLAVAADARGRGVGAALVIAMERRARTEGATEVWLHARDSAYGFYERLGYRFAGDTFVSALTGIPHRTMRKALR